MNSTTSASMQKPFPVDMTTKVGGRLFEPALPVVDGSPPTELELGFQSTLDAFTQTNIPLEPAEGIRRRERVLNRMGELCRDWIRTVCIKKGLSTDVVNVAGGQLFTSGSYRLGVHEPGADIDTILVSPNACQRMDFFGTTILSTVEGEEGTRDPTSLAERIRTHPDVTNFVPVESAAVPILTFDWEGINIDLLFARLNTASVPSDFDIDNDAVLDGADGATEKSLNGPRVTNLIAALVSGTPQRYQVFLTVVRCVRKWAKARGLYSNKMGYWGGVNINIGVALVVQLYPNACGASLLRKFFLVFKTWRWPQPLLLTKPHDAGYGLPVWSVATAVRQVAPMITPAYPAMNSTLAVSRQTLQILQEEFNRGHTVVDQLWKDYQKNPAQELNWNTLFEPSDFFINYPNYLSLCIVGPTQAEAQAWAGFVESRLRKLVSDLLGRSLPLKKIQLWPKKLEVCIADKSALLTQAQRQNCITYIVGFHVDKLRMRGDNLNAELALQNFREWELGRFQPLIPGMDILTKAFKVKELPKICFEDVYEGGKAVAMQKRRRMRDSDPARQERKRLERLEALKAKMAEIQRKKDAQEDRKRKRDDDETEEEALAQAVKIEGDGDTNEQDNENIPESTTSSAQIETEETDLLQSALDTIQESGDRKTREEAEAEKGKLLSGELLDEGEGNASDEEVGYTGDGARQMVYKKVKKNNKFKNKRCLPPSDEDAELLRKLGYAIVSDDESKIIGTDLHPPLRVDLDGQKALPDVPMNTIKIKFREKFDIVELDSNGHVIDMGDDDFSPSKNWVGRKAGFEFKLGERGLGYYRTGKAVRVPSNTAY
jgi:poly(A) polymerase